MAEMTPARRRVSVFAVILGASLIVERVIAFNGQSVEGRADEVSGSMNLPSRAEIASAPTTPLLHLDRLDARRAAQAQAAGRGALFAALSWQAPKPKARPAEPPPAPQPVAPAFPYPYIGGMSDDGVRTGYFTRGERVLALRAGDTVDASFRVDQINESQMTLTYLPLEQTVTVVFGAVR